MKMNEDEYGITLEVNPRLERILRFIGVLV